MPLSMIELSQAKEAAAALLGELGLEAFLFEIEPHAEHWQLTVECAIENGWQTTTLPVAKALLLASRDDAAARKHLLYEWRERLAPCKTGPSAT